MTLHPFPAVLVLLAACAPVHRWQVDFGEPSALPIVHPSNDRERWYVVADLGEPGEHVFFFDTGYGTTTCDDDFVASLGLTPRGQVRVRGEAGTVGALAAVANAVQDAVWDRGIRQVDMPFTPHRMWDLLNTPVAAE